MRVAVFGCFRGLEEEENKVELKKVLGLRVGSQGRIDRVNRWVDKVLTRSPSTAAGGAGGGPGGFHPVALAAAMMMGFPPPGLGDGNGDADEDADMDMIRLLLEDPDDPDVEELRPRLKERFIGWQNAALTVKGGTALLGRVYSRMVGDDSGKGEGSEAEGSEGMSFLLGNDVTEAMIVRCVRVLSFRDLLS